MSCPAQIHFNDPDRPGQLRDMLDAAIADVPAGGEIHWVCYYFRDRRLAQALIRAHRRGVKVCVSLAAKPRTSNANESVIRLLSGADGIGQGLRQVLLPGIPAPSGRSWRLQLHEKLYCFSHPQPIAYIGSFNPSGDVPELQPEIIKEIGDQDRGYNVLVGLSEPILVDALIQHAKRLHRKPPSVFYRFSAEANQALRNHDTTVYFWPRMGRHPLIQFLTQFSSNTRMRFAASHIRADSAVSAMIALARRGVELEIIAEPTHRRVTAKVEQRLISAGIHFKRIDNSKQTPMHLKFILIEQGEQKWSVFGSFNWTLPSFWLNHEIAAISSDPELFSAFAGQWERLKREVNE